MALQFDFEPEDIIKVSAKTGQGVDLLLETIVKKITPPIVTEELRCFLIDSWYVKDKGVVLLL